MDAMGKKTTDTKKSNAFPRVYINENLDDQDYLKTDFIDSEQSKTGVTFDELVPPPMGNPEGNPQHDTENVLHDEDLLSFVDNSLYNPSSENSFYLSPVQSRLATGDTDITIDQTKQQTPSLPVPADRQTSETMYEEIPEIPEYLELEEFPTQAAVQTSDTQPSNSTRENIDVTRKNTKHQERSDSGRDVYIDDDLNDEEYLRTDLIENELPNTAPECSDQELPTSMGKPQHNAENENVLHGEALPKAVFDISSCNTVNLQVFLSPVQHKPVTGNTDNTIDQIDPQKTPPPSTTGRHPGDTMYEEIPEIPEYLELDEIPPQATVQTPAIQPATSTKKADIRGRKRIAASVVVGVLACVITIAIALFITYRHPPKNEDIVNLKNVTESKGTFTY